MLESFVIRQLGLQPYEKVVRAMRRFTDDRKASSTDEIWLVQHPQVFTQGLAGKAEHLLQPGSIPVIQSDRGGQVTFHGPGQQVMYILLDLRRFQLEARGLITQLESTVISTLAHFSISAHTIAQARGVYVSADKICSLALRIRKHYSFHGLALNVDMDLSPFLRINPCGYPGLRMTQVSDLAPGNGIDDVAPVLLAQFLHLLNARSSSIQDWDPTQYDT
ncbi:lipoyl(octanoyl) transferase LipB [secondary endosymbiont of Ctenarytaina eucalypti]|uniref:Octanoyltransferase n=1 Tax=secondary endosymbiont of Ctenarytaina eucalypti TaxID=1199245 RepID=J3TF47_9ENTR|nr:lipoyl(octanoyl) transferase LipB [secondary endosymbiont of Ctenarytaina eucalypti]AFP84682.1 lipoate-protein ligase B [secondary endosymbiont of Ctenarytaina eucalypti]